MLVFVSWSGSRSKKVAHALENWLVQVIQAVEPWISTDIEKGARWSPAIADRLERSKVGIICLTRENLDSPWILFEAGALSKTKDTYVCTFLLDLRPTDLEQPLAQFQATTTEKEDVRLLVKTINNAVRGEGERSLSESVLDEIFETYWPRLESYIQEAASTDAAASQEVRSDREVLEEILELMRRQEKREVQRQSIDKEISRLRNLLGQSHGASDDPSLLWSLSARPMSEASSFKAMVEKRLEKLRETERHDDEEIG